MFTTLLMSYTPYTLDTLESVIPQNILNLNVNHEIKRNQKSKLLSNFLFSPCNNSVVESSLCQKDIILTFILKNPFVYIS